MASYTYITWTDHFKNYTHTELKRTEHCNTTYRSHWHKDEMLNIRLRLKPCMVCQPRDKHTYAWKYHNVSPQRCVPAHESTQWPWYRHVKEILVTTVRNSNIKSVNRTYWFTHIWIECIHTNDLFVFLCV